MPAKASKKFLGAILAAGRGSRAGALGRRYPKSALPIANKPLIAYQVALMRAAGITDVYIVVGHRRSVVTGLLGTGGRFGVRLHYLEQEELLGPAHAAALLEPHVDHPFVLMLGDIYFDDGNLLDMVGVFQEKKGCAVLSTDKTPTAASLQHNFAVHVAADGLVSRVVEKPRDYGTPAGVEGGVGVYLFDLPIFDAIRRTPRTAPKGEYELTSSIQRLIDDGHPVRSVNAVHGVVNLTTPCDLLAANLRAAGGSGESLIGPGCRIHNGAEIEDSVIGAGVTVRNPISIRRSLVLDSTELVGAAPIEDSVAAPGMLQHCNRERSRRVTQGGPPADAEA